MAETELWALHIEGPDSVLAMPSRDVADEKAAEINAAYETFTKRPDHNPRLDVRWHANVVPWPYSAADHAEELEAALEGVESGDIW